MGFIADAFTGKKQAKAATQAGQIQADASKYAADLAQKQYEQSRQDQKPWLDAGRGALGGLQQMLANNSAAGTKYPSGGGGGAPTQSAPAQSVTSGGGGNSSVANKGAAWLGGGGLVSNVINSLVDKGGNSGGTQNGSQLTQQPSAGAGAGAGAGAAEPMVSDGSGVFTDKWGQRLDDAYTNGKLTGGLDPNNFETDPSYQFRKKEGMDGIQSSAAASGGLLSGAALKALTGYNSDLASQEYGNAWQRDQAQKEREWGVLNGGRTQDYNIFQSENSRKFNQMASVAGTGQTTATNLGSLGAANAQTVGDGAINASNARANGLVGAANAKANGFRNLIGVGTGLLGLI